MSFIEDAVPAITKEALPLEQQNPNSDMKKIGGTTLKLPAVKKDPVLTADSIDSIKEDTLDCTNAITKEEQPNNDHSHDNGVLDLCQLRQKSPYDLLRQAENLGLLDLTGMSKQDLIFCIVKKMAMVMDDLVIIGSGVAEVVGGGFAFIRSFNYNYLASQDDIYISSGQVRKLGIRTGDFVAGKVRAPTKEGGYFALEIATEINNCPVSNSRSGGAVSHSRCCINFESLIPFYPDCHIKLECKTPRQTPDGKADLIGRIIDIVSPLGRGQRALVVAQPKTGKTILQQTIAHSIATNYPDIHLIILLIDERPEEVTDMKRSVKAEVISSTFDEPAERHVHIAEFVIEKAKRLVERGEHVVILLDSITRLARAYNSVVPSSGKLLSGGVDSNALQRAKRLFGAARNIEGGGSLTIIGTALVDTGSRMDELIYEEFKGTGNSEIILDRKLAEKRLFPAMDISKSGTRKEELLFEKGTLNKIWMLRRILNQMTDTEAMEFMIERLQRTKTNQDFFLLMDRKGN